VKQLCADREGFPTQSVQIGSHLRKKAQVERVLMLRHKTNCSWNAREFTAQLYATI
jgi:hypothetical protein